MQGNRAHGDIISGHPLRIGAHGRSVPLLEVPEDRVVDLVATRGGVLLVQPFASPEAAFSYSTPVGGLINTTPVEAAPAPGAGLRNYVTGMSLQNASNLNSTEVVLLDDAAVIWRGWLGINTLLTSNQSVNFAVPVRLSVNKPLRLACLTAAAAVYANIQGFKST